MGASLVLDSARLRENIRVQRAHVAPSELMVVVKDDAYGHGAEWAAREAAAEGVRGFGAYDLATALRVRRVTPRGTRIFTWARMTADEIREALAHELDLGVGSADQLDEVVRVARANGATARVHLKIDSGLHRNGVRPEDWAEAVATALAAEREGILRLVGVWSHLSETSAADDDASQRIFLDAVAQAREAGAELETVHLTASAASWERAELRGSLCRVGAFCYGIRSAGGAELPGIVPVARLVAPVERVEGDAVVLGIGSLDGLPSTLAGSEVGTPGGRRRILRLTETECLVEPWPGARAGDEVRIFGDGALGEHSATTLAERIGTVGEEILVRLSPQLRREVSER